MKTFKELINEIAEPRSPDEQRFKMKHVIQRFRYPIDPEIEDQMFKGTVPKDHSKPASYTDGEDEAVYEGWSQPPKKLSKGYSSRVEAERAEDQLYKKEKRNDTFVQKINGKFYVVGGGKFSIGEEKIENLDEISNEKLRDYASAALQDRNKAKANKRWKYAKKAMDKVASKDVNDSTYRKYRKVKEEVDFESFEDLIEAVRPGNLKLKDGSLVRLSRADADAITELFDNLSSSNKTRMEKEMMRDANGYDKILQFAKEAQ